MLNVINTCSTHKKKKHTASFYIRDTVVMITPGTFSVIILIHTHTHTHTHTQTNTSSSSSYIIQSGLHTDQLMTKSAAAA